MQILDNVVHSSPPSEAVLSNRFLKQLDKFLEIEAEALKPVHDDLHVRQQGRVFQRGFVQHEPFPTPFQLLRRSVSLGLCDRC